MNKLFESIHWSVYAAVGAIVLISAAAFIWGVSPSKGPASAALPPIQEAKVEHGFVGKQPFGLWLLVCENLTAKAESAQPTATRVCRTNSRVLVRGPNNAALLAAGLNVVMTNTQAGPGLLVRLPPAARAASSVNFAIDKHEMFKVPLRCSKTECLAQGALPADAVTQMRAGTTFSILYTIKDKAQKDRKVRVDQLLHGFRQSYDAMKAAMAA